MMGPVHDHAHSEADTIEASCRVCVLRSRIEAACVRARVTLVTAVTTYSRPRCGPHALQTAVVMLTFEDGDIVRGEGGSVDEAVVEALEIHGVNVFESRSL